MANAHLPPAHERAPWNRSLLFPAVIFGCLLILFGVGAHEQPFHPALGRALEVTFLLGTAVWALVQIAILAKLARTGQIRPRLRAVLDRPEAHVAYLGSTWRKLLPRLGEPHLNELANRLARMEDDLARRTALGIDRGLRARALALHGRPTKDGRKA
jgi:hypothetical protein